MSKSKIGNSLIFLLVAINIILWFVTQPTSEIAPNTQAQFYGEMIAATAMVLMGISMFLSAKPRWLERFFGGLDKMYQSHKQASILAFFLLIAHRLVIPLGKSSFVSQRLGNLAYIGIIFLVLITIAPRIPLVSRILNPPYHRWRQLHKLLGLFFIVGLVHSLQVNALTAQTIPGGFMLLMSVIGICAWIYQLVLARFLRPKLDYTIAGINRLNGTCVELMLKPAGQKLEFKPGQFVYLQFENKSGLSEPHPFTISSGAQEDQLRLSIKGSGDWTKQLADKVTVGMAAKVDGPYGMFDSSTGGAEQIWIAGGIGITPFLSWVRSNSLPQKVDLFYSVRGEEDALFWDELSAADAQSDSLKAYIRYSSVDGNMSAEEIANAAGGSIINKHIYLCGPVKMTEAFVKKFKAMGVPAGNIHFEEFNFR